MNPGPSNPKAFTKLPADIFSHILKYLNEEDHVKFARTSAGMRNMLQTFCRSLYPQVILNFRHFKMMWPIFVICHTEIKDLEVDISQIMAQLKRPQREQFIKMASQMTSLKSLSMWSCAVDKSLIVHQLFSAFEQLPNLKTLHISIGMKNMYGISKLHHLEELYFNQVDAVHVDILIQIFKANPKLRVVELPSQVAELKKLIPYMGNIESLSLHSRSYNFKYLAKLPKLQKLDITTSANTQIKAKNFEYMVNKPQSEMLMTTLKIRAILDASDIALIAKMKTLRILNVGFREANCLSYLAELPNLIELVIDCATDDDLSQGALNVLRGCRRIQYFHIRCGRVGPNFKAKADKLMKEIESYREFVYLQCVCSTNPCSCSIKSGGNASNKKPSQ